LFIIGVQEPPTYKGHICSFLPKHVLIYDHSSEALQAAIYALKDLNMWPMPEFTNWDIAATMWKTNDRNLPEVIIVSSSNPVPECWLCMEDNKSSCPIREE
jgi:hypothetical protein